MKSFCRWLFVAVTVSACSSSGGPGSSTQDGGTANGDASGSGEGGSCPLGCSVPAPSNASFITDYCCPDQSSVASCSKDVIPCTPTNRTRGKAQLGFTCSTITVNPATASMNELGDDCAPIAKYASASSPKGTYCMSQIASGRTYCSHDCMVDSDCADLMSKAFCPLSNGQTTGQCTLPGG